MSNDPDKIIPTPDEETPQEDIFGAGDYGPDTANRLLREGIMFDEKSPNVPEDVREAARAFNTIIHDVRIRLNTALKRGSSPEIPRNLRSVDHFFETVQQTAKSIWETTVGSKLTDEEIPQWTTQLKQKAQENPDEAESIEAMVKVLEDPATLDDKLRTRQLGVLEGLRTVDLVLWEKLLGLTAERQHAEVRLTQKWIKQLPDETLAEWHVTREELQLIPRLSNFTNHFINVSYLKQMEKSEQEGGTNAGELSGTRGGERLYEIAPWDGEVPLEEAAEAGTYKPQTYGEAFPLELQRISRNLERIAVTVERWLSDKKVPDSYNGLPTHLRLMAEAYVSPETRPSQIADLWDRVLASAYALARGGCPVVLIPPNTAAVAGDANKIDTELRVATRFNPPEGLEQIFEQMGEQSKKFNAAHQNLLAEEHDSPYIALYSLPNGGSGPNLFYETPAEAGEMIWLHYNTTANVALNDQLPYLRGMLGREKIDEREFVNGSYVENGIHEMGHTRLPFEDEAVAARIGSGNEKEIVEELKAETQGMRTFLESFTARGEEISPAIARRTLLAKIGVQFDAIANKTGDVGSFGERYHMPAVFIVNALLKSGVLVYDEAADTYTLTDYRRGLEEVAKIGDRLVTRFYANPNCTPEEVITFANEEVRSLSEDPEIKRLKVKLGTARDRAAERSKE